MRMTVTVCFTHILFIILTSSPLRRFFGHFFLILSLWLQPLSYYCPLHHSFSFWKLTEEYIAGQYGTKDTMIIMNLVQLTSHSASTPGKHQWCSPKITLWWLCECGTTKRQRNKLNQVGMKMKSNFMREISHARQNRTLTSNPKTMFSFCQTDWMPNLDVWWIHAAYKETGKDVTHCKCSFIVHHYSLTLKHWDYVVTFARIIFTQTQGRHETGDGLEDTDLLFMCEDVLASQRSDKMKN